MTPEPLSMPEWQLRWFRLIRAMARVHSADGEQQLVDWLMRPGEPCVLAFVNAHAMNSAAVSRKFFDALMGADVVVRDGAGMSLLMKVVNQPPGLNLNGTDLIPKILAHSDGQPLALFGTRDPWLGAAEQAVRTRIAPHSTCVTAHGFMDVAGYIRLAAQHRPRVIVLGMGMPRQEEVAVALRAALNFPCLIICGGAIIDFLGGKTPRAPRWMRAAGMEWLFRLTREPRRLFARYVAGNPVFIGRAVQVAVRSLRRFERRRRRSVNWTGPERRGGRS